MSLMSPFVWPWILIGLSCLITFLTALDLPAKLRSRRLAGPASGKSPESTATKKATVPVSVRIVRNGGIFWFCAGMVTVVHALAEAFRAEPGAWIYTFVGLIWVVLGWRLFRSTLPRRIENPGPGGDRLPLANVVTQVGDHAIKAGQVGLVIGAIADGEEVLSGFGALEIGGTRPPDADTVFEIGSISKVFTGILLARAIEDGTLNLDDRIADLLPDGWTLPEPARGITLRHCTTHTSGLPRIPANLLGFADSLRCLLLGTDPYRHYTEESFHEALASVRLDHEPGTKFAYSNFAVGLLGFVLARQKGADYETLVKNAICQPLGMVDTVITDQERVAPRLATPYRLVLKLGQKGFGLTSDEWWMPNHLAGAGALRSTGRDMLMFLKANMGLVATPLDAALRRSHGELFSDTDQMTLGMNWIRTFDDDLAQNIVWHNGGTGGFRTYLGFTEDRRVGVFVLGNSAHSVDSLAIEILKSLAREQAAA